MLVIINLIAVIDFIQGSVEKISSLTNLLDNRRRGAEQPPLQSDGSSGLFGEEASSLAAGGGVRSSAEEAEGDSLLSAAAFTAKTEQV